MQLKDWHVIEDIQLKKQYIVYGPIDEFIEECEPQLDNNYTEIPLEKWSVNQIVEIIGNLLEDNNHSTCDMTETIRDTLTKTEISDKSQQKFFQLYIKEMFNRYGY